MHNKFNINIFLFGTGFILLITGLLIIVSTKPTSTFNVNQLVDNINHHRGKLSKSPLVVNSQLMNAAQTKAEDMAAFHYFGNVSPNGVTAWDYFKKSGYKYEVAGENISITNKSIDDVAEAWMQSDAHESNIIENDYRDIGIGIAKINGFQKHTDTSVVVAFFGKDSSTQTINAPTNPAGTVTTLKPVVLTILPAIVMGIGIFTILIGAFLEVRHIRRQGIQKQNL